MLKTLITLVVLLLPSIATAQVFEGEITDETTDKVCEFISSNNRARFNNSLNAGGLIIGLRDRKPIYYEEIMDIRCHHTEAPSDASGVINGFNLIQYALYTQSNSVTNRIVEGLGGDYNMIVSGNKTIIDWLDYFSETYPKGGYEKLISTFSAAPYFAKRCAELPDCAARLER